MEKDKIEELRDRVPCAALLQQRGWAIDLKESTRRAVKYRKGDEIVIVIHDGRGWFDPQSEAKGDVYSLAEHLGDDGFAEAVVTIASLVGFVLEEPGWKRQARQELPAKSIPERWRGRRRPWPGSATWRYLTDLEARAIPEAMIAEAIRRDLIREGPYGSMWAAHTDGLGAVTGWEERGPDWRGFATGGAKELFRFGSSNAVRICVTEAAIDTMSLVTIEDMRPDTLYISTGGGWSPATDAAIRAIVARPGTLLVAATDNNDQGKTFAERLQLLASEAACSYERLSPRTDDWNNDLRVRRRALVANTAG